MKHVKIYGTLGPSCRDEDTLKKMFDEGMDGIRLNLSHTRLDDSAALIETYHKAAASCGIRPELLVDMQGPELRIGKLEQPLSLREGDLIAPGCIPFPQLVLEALKEQKENQEANRKENQEANRKANCKVKQETNPEKNHQGNQQKSVPQILPDGGQILPDGGQILPDGGQILLDDGKILLKVAYGGLAGQEYSESAGSGYDGFVLQVIRGGCLESRKSVALPGCVIHTPAMTGDDRENILRAKAYGVTSVMQPFVRSEADLMEVRSALDQAGCQDIRLFAKIENMEGIRRLDELIPHCDEIVIARGDLGNAMNLWELPAAQKRIAAACRAAGRDFMVVTQMLDSMIHRQVPTRAEVSDIFNAVLDGASSVMVTGETAAGDYPVDVIRYLAGTVREAERYLAKTFDPVIIG